MIETVIFDMDGVIIDSEPIHMKIEQDIFHELGLSISKQEHEMLVGRSDSDFWKYFIKKYELANNLHGLINRTQNRYHRYLKENQNIQSIPGVMKLIDALHKNSIQLVLASSAAMETINIVSNILGLAKYFSHTISGATLAHSKPHPEIFQIAARLTKTDPKSCLVIEDATNGVRAAKAAGMKCIGYRNPNSGNQDLRVADLIIDSYDKLSVARIRGM